MTAQEATVSDAEKIDDVAVKPEGANGDWTADCKAWMPLPAPPLPTPQEPRDE